MGDDGIARLHGRRVWDSRGNPTVEVEITTAGGHIGRGIAPAGLSTGSGEVLDRRDQTPAFGGMDVRDAVDDVNDLIAPALLGLDVGRQEELDERLGQLDGTTQLSRLGGNATIAVSMAAAWAAAGSTPLWRHLGGGSPPQMPLPEVQIFGGGLHAGKRIDIQDLMVTAPAARSVAEALDWSAEIHRAAGTELARRGEEHGVADEGGWWPAFSSNEEALQAVVAAIEAAGLRPGEDVFISIDVAASTFWSDGRYRLGLEGRALDRDEWTKTLLGWVVDYPIISIEDPFSEADEEGFIGFTREVGERVQVVGDDLLVTSAARIHRAADIGAANCSLIKPNQVGTLTGARAAVRASREGGLGAIMSGRSGETEDVSIVHLAVGWRVPQLKVGSMTRGERTVKWNECLRIEGDEEATFAGWSAFEHLGATRGNPAQADAPRLT